MQRLVLSEIKYFFGICNIFLFILIFLLYLNFFYLIDYGSYARADYFLVRLQYIKRL